jgi:hypothetical protein
VRPHWPLLGLLVAAAAVRVAVLVAFRPALWYVGDSIGYVQVATHVIPYQWRPILYALFLAALRPLHSFLAATVIQQLLGLGLGAAVYGIALRLGARRWLATLAAVPVLFDGYLLAVEQSLLSETLFMVVLLAALYLLIRSGGRPPLWACLVSGLLFACADLTRTAGLPLIVLAGLFLLVRRAGLLRLVALLVAFALPVIGYSAAYDSWYDEFTVSAAGFQLYGEVMSFAHCDRLPRIDHERLLCVPAPPAIHQPQNWYIFAGDSPVFRLPGNFGRKDGEARSFAVMVIEHQPLDYARKVGGQLAGYLLSVRADPEPWYRFASHYRYPPWLRRYARTYLQGAGPVVPHARGGLLAFLRGYQSCVYLPGVGYLLLLLLGLAGWIFGRDPARRGVRSAAGLLSLSGLVLIVLPSLAVPIEQRYRLPPLLLLCLAAALGVTALGHRLHRGSTTRPAALRGPQGSWPPGMTPAGSAPSRPATPPPTLPPAG